MSLYGQWAVANLPPSMISRSAVTVITWIIAVVFATSDRVCAAPATQNASGMEQFPPWQGSKLEGTGADPLPFVTVPLSTANPWAEPICMVKVPGDPLHRNIVLERWGSIWLQSPDNDTRSLFLQFDGAQEIDKKQRRPFCLGAVFHHDYPNTPDVFVAWNRWVNNAPITRLSRFQVNTKAPLRADPESEEILFEFEADGHRGGDLKFGPDNFLYMSSGDGSSPGDPNNVGQTTDNFLGSILRIDVDNQEAGKPYRVPPDNPFIDTPGIYPEVWAYGLRNPWRMNFHPDTGELWLGDNGDEHWEMVHRIKSGANYGWSAFEGSHIFRATNQLAGPTLVHTPPEVEHSHQEMRSVIGGLWYRGTKFPELKGWYLYGCHFTRKIWGFPMEDDKPAPPVRLADTGGQIVSFAEDENHEVLVVTLDLGILRLEKAPKNQKLEPIPTLLSQTGLFTSTANHEDAPGILPYEINAPAYWDGARRKRYMGVPPLEKIQVQLKPPGLGNLDENTLRTTTGLDRWKMPEGSVLFQTFFLGEGDQERRIETQISLKDRGEWRFLTYRWKDDQTDAALIPENGETAILNVADPSAPEVTRKQSWHFPGRAECTACHTQRSMFVLGVNNGQLNRDFDYSPLGGRPANQLETLRHLKFFPGNFRPTPQNTGTPTPDPHDASLPLDQRARSYLHVNCAHCHRETGLGGRANFQLLHWLATNELGLINARPLVGLPGLDPSQAKLVAPGDPDRSEIYRRIATHGTGKMPLLGGTLVDEKGAALIQQWIESMKIEPTQQ
jgi:mono/diheme cytochrome c family protein